MVLGLKRKASIMVSRMIAAILVRFRTNRDVFFLYIFKYMWMQEQDQNNFIMSKIFYLKTDLLPKTVESLKICLIFIGLQFVKMFVSPSFDSLLMHLFVVFPPHRNVLISIYSMYFFNVVRKVTLRLDRSMMKGSSGEAKGKPDAVSLELRVRIAKTPDGSFRSFVPPTAPKPRKRTRIVPNPDDFKEKKHRSSKQPKPASETAIDLTKAKAISSDPSKTVENKAVLPSKIVATSSGGQFKTMYSKPIKLEAPNIKLLQNIDLLTVQVTTAPTETMQYTFKVRDNGETGAENQTPQKKLPTCSCGCGNKAVFNSSYNPALYTQAKIKYDKIWNQADEKK